MGVETIQVSPLLSPLSIHSELTSESFSTEGSQEIITSQLESFSSSESRLAIDKLTTLVATLREDNSSVVSTQEHLQEISHQQNRLQRLMALMKGSTVGIQYKLQALKQISSTTSCHTGKTELELQPALCTLVLAQVELLEEATEIQSNLLTGHIDAFLQEKQVSSENLEDAKIQLDFAIATYLNKSIQAHSYKPTLSQQDVEKFMVMASKQVQIVTILEALSRQLASRIWSELSNSSTVVPETNDCAKLCLLGCENDYTIDSLRSQLSASPPAFRTEGELSKRVFTDLCWAIQLHISSTDETEQTTPSATYPKHVTTFNKMYSVPNELYARCQLHEVRCVAHSTFVVYVEGQERPFTTKDFEWLKLESIDEADLIAMSQQLIKGTETPEQLCTSILLRISELTLNHRKFRESLAPVICSKLSEWQISISQLSECLENILASRTEDNITQILCTYLIHKDLGPTILPERINRILAQALENDDRLLLELCIDGGANLNIEINGNTLINLAILQGNTIIVQLILKSLATSIDSSLPIDSNTFHLAVQEGRRTILTQLNKYPLFDINKYDRNGHTPLHVAAKKRDSECIKVLLSNPSIEPTTLTKVEHCSALSIATLDESLQCMKALLENEAVKASVHSIPSDVNQTVSTLELSLSTPLTYAVEFKKHKALSLMLEQPRLNITSNYTGKHGSLLHLAVHNDDGTSISLLVGYDQNILNCKNEYESTAFIIAITLGHADSIAVLLELGCDVLLKTHDGSNSLLIAAAHGNVELARHLMNVAPHMLDESNEGGFTPFLAACHSGHIETVTCIYTKQGLPTAKTITGLTGAHLAAIQGHSKLLERLIFLGTSTDDVFKDNGVKYNTFDLAIKYNRVKVQAVLLSHGYQYNFQHVFLSIAEHANDSLKECVSVVGIKEQLNITTRVNLTALHFAASMNNPSAVRILTSAGADLEVRHKQLTQVVVLQSDTWVKDCIMKNGMQYTPLHKAIAKNAVESARALLDAGSDVNARVMENDVEQVSATPLYIAAFLNLVDMVKLLLEYKADVNALHYRYFSNGSKAPHAAKGIAKHLEHTTIQDLLNNNI